MASITIPWNDGNGNIILTYTGQGDGTVTVRSSTNNLGQDRRQTITLKTTGANPATATVTIIQPTGMRVIVTANSHRLKTADGDILRCHPSAQ